VLSPEVLTANIAALAKAQGKCPTLGALPDSVRVAVSTAGVHLEMRAPGGGWQGVDFPSGPGADSTWLADGTSPGASQLIVVGVGLGYALAKAERLPIRRVLAIEPHPGLATLLLSRSDWRRWFADGRLRLLTGPDYEGAADVARFLDGLRDISVVSHPMRVQAEPEVMAHAASVAERVAQNARANGNARRKFAGPYLLQTLTNLEAIAAGADLGALDGAFTGVPAVVAGAGPSLDENARQLAPLQDRALVITADTALRPLLTSGVRPHLAVAVDSSELNARHVTAADGAEDVMLAAEGSVHPSAFARFEGRTFGFRISNHEPWPWLRDAAGIERPEVRTWASVLTSAFQIARRAGCNPIVFVGADMAYTGMRPYCRGTIYDAMWQEWMDRGCTWDALMAEYFSRQPEIWQADVRGEPARTAPHLVSFRDWLVDAIAAAADGTFINATGAGILHGRRVRQASLDEALGDAPRHSGLRELFAARHAAGTRPAEAARAAELRRLARTRAVRLPLERWVDFAVSTVSREDILQALAGPSR